MMTIINKAKRSLPAITTLHASTALALTRNCVVSARIGYLARVSELADNVDAFFSTFDRRCTYFAVERIVDVRMALRLMIWYWAPCYLRTVGNSVDIKIK